MKNGIALIKLATIVFYCFLLCLSIFKRLISRTSLFAPSVLSAENDHFDFANQSALHILQAKNFSQTKKF